MITLEYLIQSSLLAAVVYILHISFRNQLSYGFQRHWLNFGLLASMLIPLFEFNLFPSTTGQAIQQVVMLPVAKIGTFVEDQTLNQGMLWWNVAIIVYLVIASFLLFRFIYGILQIFRLIKNGTLKRTEDFTYVYTNEIELPFSFGKYLFWSKEWSFSNEETAMILKHERTHIRLFHTVDILYYKILQIVAWFHPLIYFYLREIRNIHEYQADQETIKAFNRHAYLKMLFQKSTGAPFALSHSIFAKSIIKRIKNMKKMKSKKSNKLIKASFICLFAALAILVSCNDSIEVLEDDITLNKQEDNHQKTANNEAYVYDTALVFDPETGLETKELIKIKKSEIVYKVVDEMPRFPGCEDLSGKERNQCAQQKMLKYIYENVKYPEADKKAGHEGMAVVSFVVETDGSLRNIKVVRNPGGTLGEAAATVVKKMIEEGIRWSPGLEKGKKVRVKFALPIKFQLD